MTHAHTRSSTAWLDFDLSAVTERFRLKSPNGRLAEELELETRRFLWLSAHTDQSLVPSDLVDEYWHALILNTRTYRDYCERAFGRFIEHANGIPSFSSAALSSHTSGYVLTLELYKTHLGIAPTPEVWPQVAHRLQQRLDKYKKPFRLHLETTNHCNLRCEHCYPESSSLEPHHTRESLSVVFDEAKRLGVDKITLTGGELLTRPDWQQVISHALDVCDNVYFITNGLLLTRKKLEWLARQRTIRSMKKWPKTLFKNAPVEIGVAISLDGLQGNELVRKNDRGIGVQARQILEKIKLAVGYGLHVTVNTTITNELSAREIFDLYTLLKDLGIDRWQLDQAYLAGRMANSEVLDADLSWLNTAKANYKLILADYLKDYPKVPSWRLEIVQVFRYDNLIYGYSAAASLDEHPCSYHFGSVIVEEGNLVRFCPSLRDAGIGRVAESVSLETTYQTAEFQDFLGKSISDLPCKSCRYGKLFHGGCRANSLSYVGDMWASDPICCSLAPFVEDEVVPMLAPYIQDSFRASLQGGPRPGDAEHGATQRRRQRVIHLHPAE